MTDTGQERLLLSRIRSGDPAACDECIRLHAAAIYRLALRLTRDRAEAEDVMQDTFLNAFRGIDGFDGRASLATWLNRIAYNAAMMRLRKRQPGLVPLDEVGESQEGTPLPQSFYDWSSLPDQELEKAEVRRELERAIGELPPKLRAVFLLRELEDLSTEETAGALGITENTVKMRLHRARLRLREILTGWFAQNVQTAQE